MARRSGGVWLLRMEDLDTPRVVPGAADDILRTLDLLGLHWDGEVIWQSRRTDLYAAVLARLTEGGHVYPCGCSRAEIARSSSAPHPGEEGSAYPGTCREGVPDGKIPRAFRVRVGDEDITFDDLFRGRCCHNLLETCGDFIVKRADGPFAYHLAVVIDDAESGVTQVVRGADLLTSTPRQIHLQRLLGYPSPRYGHLPLVTDPQGGKLSKRLNAVSLAAGKDLRHEGGALLTDALTFLGQLPPPELAAASPSAILSWGVEHFEPERVPGGAGPFPSGSQRGTP